MDYVKWVRSRDSTFADSADPQQVSLTCFSDMEEEKPVHEGDRLSLLKDQINSNKWDAYFMLNSDPHFVGLSLDGFFLCLELFFGFKFTFFRTIFSQQRREESNISQGLAVPMVSSFFWTHFLIISWQGEMPFYFFFFVSQLWCKTTWPHLKGPLLTSIAFLLVPAACDRKAMFVTDARYMVQVCTARHENRTLVPSLTGHSRQRRWTRPFMTWPLSSLLPPPPNRSLLRPV